MDKVVDTQNTLLQHVVVGIFALILAVVFNLVVGMTWSTSFARISFILLFLTLIISPIMRIKKPSEPSDPMKSPWCWRGELGIWFAVTGLVHFYFAMGGHIGWDLSVAFGPGGYGLANLMGLIALIWAIVLAVTSSNKLINYLGMKSWKWLHSFTYVVFYLVSLHVIYFQFFSEYGLKNLGKPNWFGYTAVAMMIILIIMQAVAFVKSVSSNK